MQFLSLDAFERLGSAEKWAVFSKTNSNKPRDYDVRCLIRLPKYSCRFSCLNVIIVQKTEASIYCKKSLVLESSLVSMPPSLPLQLSSCHLYQNNEDPREEFRDKIPWI